MNTDQAPNAAIVSAAMPGWAKKVFPNKSEEDATELLWDKIFDICRVRNVNPVAAWTKHREQLIARCNYLNEKQYRELRYRGRGTDLRVGLPDNHVWLGGGQEKKGIYHMPNIPTEEVFTTPHRERVNGTVTNTKPLAMRGMYVPKFSLTFVDGKVVKAVANDGFAYLDNLLESDAGARYLGEVALVPHSSPISQSGILFYNGLYDENAACHLALGRAYREGIKDSIGISEEDFMAKGGNESAIHVDFMIGNETLAVDGVLADGSVEAIMRNGEWVFEL
jgi:aminopeptidase